MAQAKTNKQATVVLKKIRNLIKSPKNWCQGPVAKDAFNAPIRPWNTDACQWCLFGAVLKIDGTDDDVYMDNIVVHRLNKALPKSFNGNYIDYNENRSHRSVIRLLDKAIKG